VQTTAVTVTIVEEVMVIFDQGGSQVLVAPPEVFITNLEGDFKVMLSPALITKVTVVVPTSIEVAVDPAGTIKVSPELTPER